MEIEQQACGNFVEPVNPNETLELIKDIRAELATIPDYALTVSIMRSMRNVHEILNKLEAIENDRTTNT